jgi:tetratricopeptide (TPR) repeat protein
MISVINSEQMAIRLSRLIKDTSYEITWEEKPIKENDSTIDQTLLYNFMSDWMQSKVSLSWLRTFFTPIMENPLVRTPFTNSQHMIYNSLWLIETKAILLSALGQKNTLQLINEYPAQEAKILGALYLMLCAQQSAFDRVAKMGDVGSQKNRLTRVLGDIQKKNYFEILGLSPKSRPQDFKRSYHDLAKNFHPDKLQPGTDQELVTLTKEIFAIMTTAYEVLTNDAKKAAYIKEMEQGKAEKILASESLAEEGKAALKSGQIAKAIEKLRKAMELRPPSSDLNLHFLWARLVQYATSSAGTEELRELEENLNKVPPEDRHSALYYFVKGLLQRCLGDLNSAKRNLQHAVSLSPNFIEAQRELNLVRNTPEEKPVDIFRDDLSKVVSHIFKKK